MFNGSEDPKSIVISKNTFLMVLLTINQIVLKCFFINFFFFRRQLSQFDLILHVFRNFNMK